MRSSGILLVSWLAIYSGVVSAVPNYAEILHMSYLFYHAQQSGKLNGKRRLAWRSDSCFECQGPGGEDLSGGFYEAANTMKWGLPYSFVVFQLAHNLLTFKDGHIQANEYGNGLEILKWAADWLIHAHPSKYVFHGQVGSSDIDFDFFGPPEEYELWAKQNNLTSAKPVYTLSTSDPGSEIVAQASAALAATAMVFKDIDATYANVCLSHARDLYAFAVEYPRSFMNSTQVGYLDHKDWYPSTDNRDERALAAAMLYRATNETAFLTDAETVYNACCNEGGYAYDWDDKGPLLHVVLYEITKKDTYKGNMQLYMNDWINHVVPHTPLGLAYRFYWGSNRYAANTAYLAFAQAKYLRKFGTASDANNATAMFNYGLSQIQYILGEGPNNRSWFVGYGNNYPKSPYHKSSYNPYIDWPLRGHSINESREDFLGSTRTNTFILYGAVVGGPYQNDSFVDNRHDYEYTEVTLDYNSGFTGAVAALVEIYGGVPIADSQLNLGFSHPNATQVTVDTRPTFTGIPTTSTSTTATTSTTISSSTTTTSPPNPTTSPTPSPKNAITENKPRLIGIIAGSIAGGLILIALIVSFVFFLPAIKAKFGVFAHEFELHTLTENAH